MIPKRPLQRSKRKTRGAAVIEFAVCLPLIVLIVFGGIEAASMLFLRQTLVQAAYEGIKTGVKVNGPSPAATASARSGSRGSIPTR